MNYVSTVVRPAEQPATPAPSVAPQAPGFVRLLQALARRRFPGLIAAGVAGLCVLAANFLQSPQYEATALVVVSPGQTRVVTPEQALTDAGAESQAIETAIEIFRSPQLSLDLVRALKLDEDRAWASQQSGNTQRPEQAADRVNRAITVHRRALSLALEVTVRANSPEQAALMANTLVTLYNDRQQHMRVLAMEAADGWLTTRLGQLRRNVQEKEAAAAAARSETGLLSAGQVSLTELQISNVQTTVLDARSALAEAEARYRQVSDLVRRGGNADTLGTALNSETMRELRAREADLSRRLGELEARLGERHPSLLNARAELSTLRTQIANEVNRIIASLANEVEVARSRLRPLEASLAETRMKLVTDEQALVRVRELDREAAASREVYESFLKRSQEISDQSRLSSTDAVVASQAVAPTKRASPKLLLSLLMAVAAAALAGIAAALAVDHFRDSVTDARLTARRVGVPVIAQIPLLTRKALLQLPAELRTPGAFLIEKPLTAFAEAFRTLQSSFWFSGLSSNVRCVAVTSPLAGEGKSTVALCLARAAAQAGRRTLLVDCDLRRPSISEYFEIDPTAGVNEVLGGSVPWRDVVGMDDRSSLHILPAVAATPVHDVFAGSAIRSLLDDLRTEYDLIVLNGPPVLLVSEALSLAAAADAVAVIARWGETSHEALANALEQLASVGAPVHGLVVNAVDAATPFSGVYRDRRYYPQERV